VPAAEILSPGFSRMLPGIMLISNIRENGEPIGALPDGEMMFHHDMIHREVPSKARCSIRSRFRPRRQHAVRQRLCRVRHAGPKVRDRLEGKRALHHYNYGNQQRGSGGGTKRSTNSSIRVPHA
jgi:taurine dioxygenase